MAVTGDGAVYLVGESSPTQQFGGEDVLAIRIAPPQQGRLQILATTTRWRPQRDTATSVTINFKGPSDLDSTSVRLEVTPPAGFLATYTPTMGELTKVSGTEDQYTFDWTGPWTYTDSSGNSQVMPRGNYSLVVAGKRQGSDAEIKNETPYDKVSLVEVTTVSLVDQAECPALKANPLGTPSEAIFPEASTPGGTVCDRVEVRATVDPPVPDPGPQEAVKVYFRPLDVDDPSADGAPVDDPALQEDNLGLPSTGLLTDPTGTEQGGGTIVQVPVSGGTTASTILRVSRRQGDNYRVAASTNLDSVQALTVVPGSAIGEVTHPTTPAFVQEGVTVTKMVTVWRTIHFEIDHIDTTGTTQALLDVTGTSTALTAQRLSDQQASFIQQGTDHPRNDDWQGADLWPKASVTGSSFKVERSRPKYLEVGTTTNLTTVAAVGDTYRVVDDYTATLSPAASLGLAEEVLKSAFIVLDATGVANANVAHPFVTNRNMPDSKVGVFPKDSTSSPDYWVIQVIQAFDSQIVSIVNGKRSGDNDPDTSESAVMGMALGHAVTWPTMDAKQTKCAIFHETIRDFRLENLPAWTQAGSPLTLAEVVDQVTAHEVGHTMGLPHKLNTLMAGAFDPTANGKVIDDLQRRALREMLQPEIK
jgi:hypothetical protein